MDTRRLVRSLVAAGLIATLVPAGGAADDDGPGILFNAQGNQLDLYDLSAPVPATTRTTPIPRHQHSATPPDTTGNDVNGQICRITQQDGSVRYVMGEDSDQSILPKGVAQGWGIFAPTGGLTGPWTMVDKLVPSYNFTDPPNDHLPDNTGCAVAAGGEMLFLVDLGIGAFDAAAVGSLFVYYRDTVGNFSSASGYCVLDSHLTTAGYIATDPDDGSVLVPQSGRSDGGAVVRYRPPFPADASQCASYDLTLSREKFIEGPESFVPISIVRRGDRWLVGNVVPGMISEYDEDGSFTRLIAPPGPYNVAGMAIDGDGSLFFASLGLRPDPFEIFTTQDGAGTLWRVAFDPIADAPLPPVPIQALLDFPEGLAIYPSV